MLVKKFESSSGLVKAMTLSFGIVFMDKDSFICKNFFSLLMTWNTKSRRLNTELEASGFFSSLYKAPQISCLATASSHITRIDLPLRIAWEIGKGNAGASDGGSVELVVSEPPKPTERPRRWTHLESLTERLGDRDWARALGEANKRKYSAKKSRTWDC